MDHADHGEVDQEDLVHAQSGDAFGVNPNSEMRAVIAPSATASITAGGIQKPTT